MRILETNAVVLDFLPYGKGKGKPLPIVQAVGDSYFYLLEFVKPKDLEVIILNKIPIISRYRVINYNQLTETAKDNLKEALKQIVKKREKDFVNFINKTIPITPRLHMLELLPKIGKKITWKIIEEKEKKPFESFEDVNNRIKGNIDILESIIERIIEEYQNKDRYKLFVGVNSFLNKLLNQ